jgi:uncharacterized damage-inducible protein DinB
MNTADVLQYGHKTLLNSLDGLPEEALDIEGVCGWWSTRHIIAHLASFEHVLIDVLNDLLGSDKPTPYLDVATSPDFSDSQVERRKDQSSAQLLDEYKQAHAEVMELITRIPEETARQPGKLPWYGAQYTLNDFIVYTFYGHKREHSAQIDIFRDRLSR